MKPKSTLLTFIFLIGTMAVLQAQDRRTIDVSGFDEVSLGGSGTLYIQQGSSFRVEFEGSDEVFERMKFDVRGDHLHIGQKSSGWWSSWKGGSYSVYITMPELVGASVSGSGEIEGNGMFKTGDLDLSVSGSGEIKLGADSENIDISISGSGKIELSGTGNAIDARISGSGNVNAQDFKVRNVDARISGSGNMYVHSTESIESHISGSGSIYYTGNPKHLNNNSSGSGKIRKIN
ncbi:MAG: DUF2807 domain-containing protein [Cyclobacteriaceae bacterium]